MYAVLNRFICLLTLLAYGIAFKPNILFIIIDDLRPALGIYGDKAAFTPNIDKLSSDSFVFGNVFAQQALCAPSRNSLLTSRRPDTLHLYDFYNYWRNTVGNYTTLPQYFKENGFYTQSIGKVFHPGISSNFSDDSPYSWTSKPYHPPTEIYKEAKVCVNPDGSLARNLICPVMVEAQPGGTLPDLESADKAVEFLKNWRNITGDAPYFLAVGFHKPHVPLKFPLKYLDYHPLEKIVLPSNRWRSSSLPTVAWNPWMDVKDREDINKLNISFPFGVMPDVISKLIIQSYYSAVTYIDDLIGKLVENSDENTIIVLTSDHGWSLGEHGEYSKYSNFDVATKVPLIIRIPKLLKKTVYINDLIELVDLFPTLVDLCDLKGLRTCKKNRSNLKLCSEGRSLMPLLYSSKNNVYQSKSAVFTQYPRPGPFPTKNSDKPRLKDINIMGYSIRTNRYRYTEWIEFNNNNFTPNWDIIYGKELYDHSIDPDENLNLIDRPQLNYTVNQLKQKLLLGWRYV